MPWPVDLQLFAGEKTEKATPTKRREAREKGQVAKSMELTGAFVLFFSFLFFYLFGGLFRERLFHLYTLSFNDYMLWDMTQQNVMAIYAQLLYQTLLLIGPILFVAVVVAVLGNYIQIGFLFTGQPLAPKFSKLNPIEGAKRLFSLKSVVEFLKSLLKILIIGGVVYLTLWGERTNITTISKMPLADVLSYTGGLTLELGLKIGMILLVLAILDYFYQRYEFEKSLRMSKQDIKDEHKKSEGDPLIKRKIREKQMRMAIQRMMQEIPKADVVITNPTHYAVALQYDTGRMEAPTVLAKGRDYVALKIKEAAGKHGIVIMENRPLARALYDQVEIGQTIPAELFQAVAEVLAYVYKLKRKA